jgi:uncharacterized membrane protein
VNRRRNLLSVTLYGRKNCHLCEQAERDLNTLQDKYPHKLYVIDIDKDPDIQKAYEFIIPVIEVGPYTVKAPFEVDRLAVTLGAASDKNRQLEEKNDKTYQDRKKRAKEFSNGDRFSLWFSRHYMFVFNFFVFVYVGLPFLAPIFLKVGAEMPATVIYKLYSGLCHQLSYRSWFLFGEQPIYPRELAGIEGYLTFHQATGLDEHGLVAARNFLGNEFTGFKVALCQRDVATYGAILLFGLLFVFTKHRIKPLPFWAWILIGLVPIGFDGLSQLLGQVISEPFFDMLRPYLGFIPYRESSPFLRTLTGFLFGFTTAWFGYPLVEEAMRDARRLLVTKMTRLEGTK